MSASRDEDIVAEAASRILGKAMAVLLHHDQLVRHIHQSISDLVQPDLQLISPEHHPAILHALAFVPQHSYEYRVRAGMELAKLRIDPVTVQNTITSTKTHLQEASDEKKRSASFRSSIDTDFDFEADRVNPVHLDDLTDCQSATVVLQSPKHWRTTMQSVAPPTTGPCQTLHTSSSSSPSMSSIASSSTLVESVPTDPKTLNVPRVGKESSLRALVSATRTGLEKALLRQVMDSTREFIRDANLGPVSQGVLGAVDDAILIAPRYIASVRAVHIEISIHRDSKKRGGTKFHTNPLSGKPFNTLMLKVISWEESWSPEEVKVWIRSVCGLFEEAEKVVDRLGRS
ncbi:hypothetical protein BD324DRAFT_684362 [Kockovaella imperatae]|uniref:Uncharacterized protein n=1 Tax=Kockovaella imperatae TaxID=4999 RepID=A0A1Y1U5I2_9TREE|nr:hypothetical protein BD324DRAFT_684362 [Kockovaella imperatae]ORX33290.1 hypothetical protein BD324DRAFT_684362 [Kockovaella imperatae]